MADACITRHQLDGEHHKKPHLYEGHKDKEHFSGLCFVFNL